MGVKAKRNLLKIICGILCAVGGIILVTGIVFVVSISGMFKNNLKQFFAEWETQSDEHIAFVVDKKTVMVQDKELLLYEIIRDAFGWNIVNSPADVLCCYKGVLYGYVSLSLPQEENAEFYSVTHIYAVKISTEEARVVYTDTFFPRAMNEYGNCLSVMDKTIYYQNGKIVMCDNNRAVSLDLNTEEATDFAVGDISDWQPYSSVVDDLVWQERSFSYQINDVKTTVTLEDLASYNQYAAELQELDENAFYPFGTFTPTEHFFAYAPFAAEQKLYFICRVYDRDTETVALAFSYDVTTREFSYLYQHFVPDPAKVWDCFKIIPVE